MVAVAGLDRHQERLSQDEGGLVEGGGRPLNRAFTPSLSTREPVFFNRASKTTVNEILKREILARKKASSASCRTILFCCYPDSAGGSLADLDIEQLRAVEVCEWHRLSSFSPRFLEGSTDT